jgi:hypothetical protein
MHESEARVESFLRLQILQTILRGHVTRGAAYDDDVRAARPTHDAART